MSSARGEFHADSIRDTCGSATSESVSRSIAAANAGSELSSESAWTTTGNW